MNAPRLESYCTSGTSPTRDHALFGPEDAPCVLVLGGISARADLEWWRDMVGPGKALDTDHTRLLSVTPLGGSTAGEARRLLRLLDTLQLDLHAAVGCSYGGMAALALAALAPSRVGRLVLLGAAHRPHPLATAWRLVQRQILDLGTHAGQPARGVDLARQLAMTTYRSAAELDQRFDAASVTHWLAHHGARYAATVHPARYAELSLAIDTHDVDPTHVTVPSTLIGFDTDQLVPPWLLRELQRQTSGPCELHVVPTLHGHDGFLLEVDALTPIVSAAVGVSR
jgi:homoserine O-acetyltransferase